MQAGERAGRKGTEEPSRHAYSEAAPMAEPRVQGKDVVSEGHAQG